MNNDYELSLYYEAFNFILAFRNGYYIRATYAFNESNDNVMVWKVCCTQLLRRLATSLISTNSTKKKCILIGLRMIIKWFFWYILKFAHLFQKKKWNLRLKKKKNMLTRRTVQNSIHLLEIKITLLIAAKFHKCLFTVLFMPLRTVILNV